MKTPVNPGKKSYNNAITTTCAETLNKLIQTALNWGATDAAVISASEILIEDRFASFCLEPRCDAYGLSGGCPPNVSGPDGFRELVKDYSHALVFKIEVPSEILLSHQRQEIFQLLHEAASGIEQEAVRMGYSRSRAFAGGACKNLFCTDHANCRVLSGDRCRNPGKARPSMSGFGIDVTRLMKSAGWKITRVSGDVGQNENKMGMVSGMVLIG